MPAQFFGPTHPYNQPISQYPDETRCFQYTGGCIPIMGTVDTSLYPFGYNYLDIDPTMPGTVVDSVAHPEILATLPVVSPYGDPAYHIPDVPIRTAVVENGRLKCPTSGPLDPTDGKDHHAITLDRPASLPTGMLWEHYNVCTDTGLASGNWFTETSSTRNGSTVGWNVATFNMRDRGEDSIEAAGREVYP